MKMLKKILYFISGLLLVLVGTVLVLTFGLNFDPLTSGLPCKMMPEYVIYVFQGLALVFTMAGCIGVLLRGISQIISIFKDGFERTDIALYVDIFSVVGMTCGCVYWMLEMGSIAGFGTDMVPAFVLVLIDGIIKFLGLRHGDGRIFTKSDSWKLLYSLRLILIPAILCNVFLMCETHVEHNMMRMQLNESMSGGFDSFVVYDLDGNEYTEDMFKDHKITMINVWGTFCHPCIEEMPELQKIAEEYDPSDLLIVGLTSDLYENGKLDDEKIKMTEHIVEQTGVKYPIIIPSVELQNGAIDGKIQMFPTSIFINSKGESIDLVAGTRSQEEWLEKIEELLADEK